LPELDETSLVEAYSDHASHIANTLQSSLGSVVANRLPTVKTHEQSNPFNLNNSTDIDLDELVKLRFKNQTKQAASGVRTVAKSALDTSDKHKELTDRQRFLRGLARIVKEQESKGIGSGLVRKVRWQSGTYTELEAATPIPVHGNTANAAAAAKNTASTVSELRLPSNELHNQCLPYRHDLIYSHNFFC